MTEARLPKEPDQPGKRRVISIRNPREFTPRDPQTVNPNPFTPAKDRVTPLTVPPISREEGTGVPTATEYAPQEPGISRRTFLKMAAGTAAVITAEGALESKNMGVFSLIKSLFPKGKTETKAALQDTTPPAEKKPEDPTAAPPATPTEVLPQDAKELPYELGWESPVYGNVSFGIQKETMEKREIPNPSKQHEGKTVIVPGIHSISLNTSDFPDAEQKLNDAVLFAQYKGLMTADPSRSGMTFEQYKQKVANGEDLSFKMKGFPGKSYLLDNITIDPRQPVEFMFVANSGTEIHPFNGYAYGFRKVDGKLYIEIYDWRDTDYLNNDPARAFPSKYSAASDLSWALQLMSEESVQQTGSFSFSQVANTIPKVYEFDRFLIPSKTPTLWNSIIRAQ